MRTDGKHPEIFIGPPGDEGRPRFALPSASEVGEFLDYLEDMSLLIGCPGCRSFNVREVLISGVKVLICSDCGHTEQMPRVN